MPRVKYLKKEYKDLVQGCPCFHKSGNVKGMKNLYYGKMLYQ